MANVKHAAYYTNVFANWSKALGSKPTEAQLSLAHVFGRPGKQSLAVAMALRDGGVSGQQIKQASALFDGKATPQLNHIRDLIAAGSFDRTGPGYCLTLSDKGQKWVETHTAKAAEVKVETKKVSAKSARKAERKAKVKAAKVDVETVIAADSMAEGGPVEPELVTMTSDGPQL